jgi:hypothetical protein
MSRRLARSRRGISLLAKIPPTTTPLAPPSPLAGLVLTRRGRTPRRRVARDGSRGTSKESFADFFVLALLLFPVLERDGLALFGCWLGRLGFVVVVVVVAV